jgi:translocation and assembly module TamB
VKGTLDRVPFTAHLSLPRRNLGAYPKFIRTGAMSGEVEATADWTGSLRAPALSAHIRGYAAQPTTVALGLPVDILADVTYDGAEMRGRVQALRREGVVLEGNVDVEAPISALLDGRALRGGPWWEAKGAAQLLSFPLTGIPALADRDVTGLATGTLAFSGLGKEPMASVELNLANVKIDRAAFARGLVSGRLSHGAVLLSGKLDQAEGGASASASGRVKWSSPWDPVLDRGAPLDFFAEARDLQAAALYPVLFRGVFAHFDARLNGTLHLREERQGERDVSTVESSIAVRDASFLIREIGQEFQNGRATVTVDKNGAIDVRDVAADAVTGRFTAAGSAKLDGFRFASGEGTLAVAKDEAIPLTLEGLSIGEAWGTLKFKVGMEDERTVKLDVDVPVFHTDMPESSSRALQSMGDNPKIKVGMRADDGTLVPLWLGAPVEKRSEDALRWHLTFQLGKDVYFRRGTAIELALGGQPVVDLTDEAHVSGHIDFRSGKVEVFGKRFEVEHGTARFGGDDPGNPDVSVSARWDAPDGTRIYADFVGPLRTGVLTLRSEPLRPQNEILSILLLGSSDAGESVPGPAVQQDNGVQTAGTVLAGGAVTTSLNRVLSSVTPLDITTRVASDAQGATPEVAVQIAPGVTAQISYRTRAPSPGEKPDRVFITLDWRFRRNWSVVTTLGDQQSSVLDLIWQYRY